MTKKLALHASSGARHPLVRAWRIWLVLAAVALVALVVALSIGSTSIAPLDVLNALLSHGDPTNVEVVRQLRLPRALAAFATGGLLAVAGALMQVLLRNPLADPYVLGVSGGAAAGALGAMLLGAGSLLIDAGAFAGAVLSIAIVFGFARSDLSSADASSAIDSSPRLLLTGVILASAWSAVITLLLTLAPEAKLRGMLFWLMGDLAGVDQYGWALIALPIVVFVAFAVARDCNVLLRGAVIARSLGVSVGKLRIALYFLASIATALAVTTAGAVGFIGLLIPHAIRLAVGNDQRLLIPAAALAGGALLLIADTAARTLLSPQQLPVGVLTTMIGAPAFMLLLMRRSSR